ncbi:hypothetical protein FQN57_003375 [Myotisia sp. PD_48]|nr:hypothetical protein FQN57_003375 [Myotisia sp. PD_48]
MSSKIPIASPRGHRGDVHKIPSTRTRYSDISASTPNLGNSRLPFSKTRTLKGAFEATEPRPPSRNQNEDERRKHGDPRSQQNNLERERKVSFTSPNFGLPSPPPGELDENYRRIEDADTLAEMVMQEDDDLSHPDHIYHLSPSPGARTRHFEDRGSEEIRVDPQALDASDEDLRDSSVHVQRQLDEARLAHVTTRQTPAFSRAKVGSKVARSTQHFRPFYNNDDVDNKMDDIPPLKRSHEHNLYPNSKNNAFEKNDSVRLPVNDWENDVDFAAESLQVSESPLRHYQKDDGTRKKSPYHYTTTRHASDNAVRDWQRDTHLHHQNSDAPGLAYKSNEKPRITRRDDSHQLLRKLTRRESPVNTPEQKLTQKSLLTAKTPIVTGAWVDTPVTSRDTKTYLEVPKKEPSPIIPIKRADSPFHAPREEELPPNILSQQPRLRRRLASELPELEKPKLPKSALAAVLEDVKSGDHSLILGDNTLESLQDLLDGKQFDPRDEDFIAKEESSKSNSSSVDGSQKFPSQKVADEAVIDRLNLKLKSLLHSINEVRVGLSSIEEQAEKESRIGSSRPADKTSTARGRGSGDSSLHYHRHSTTPCDACGLHGDGRLYLALPSRRFWRRLGWSVLIFFTWWVAELLMWDYYGHPIAAARCERNCLNPNAPRYPFVIPTMLWRWSHLSLVLSPVWTILVAMFRFVAQLFGFWDGFFDSPVAEGGPFHEYQAANIRHQQPPTNYYQGESMQGDEYL